MILWNSSRLPRCFPGRFLIYYFLHWEYDLLTLSFTLFRLGTVLDCVVWWSTFDTLFSLSGSVFIVSTGLIVMKIYIINCFLFGSGFRSKIQTELCHIFGGILGVRNFLEIMLYRLGWICFSFFKWAMILCCLVSFWLSFEKLGSIQRHTTIVTCWLLGQGVTWWLEGLGFEGLCVRVVKCFECC